MRAFGGATTVASRPVAVVVMARPPALGRVKTRLARDIGEDRALATYRRLLESTLEAVGQIPDVDRLLALDDGPAVPPPAGWATMQQRGEGLGARLADTFARLFAAGHSGVTLVGSDSPALPPAYLERAVSHLRDGSSAALGPAADGGFYLIGFSRGAWLRRAGGLGGLLATTPVGTAGAFAHVAGGLERLDLDVEVLPLWVDVDVAAHLPLAERLLGSGQPERGAPFERLRELYLHVTDRCAGTCLHCYNQAGDAIDELTTTEWGDVLEQAARLGVEHFVILGGDPFLRSDVLELVDAATGRHGAAVRLFFNSAVSAEQAKALATVGRGRFTPLLSLDGPAPVNDALRGPGNHDQALVSAGHLLRAGLRPIVNAVLLRPVLDTLPELVRELAAAGLDRLHLILPHQRGGLQEQPALVPTGAEMAEALDRVEEVAAVAGVTIDNLVGWRARFRARRDLCTAGTSLLAVGPSGRVYACPIAAGDPALEVGDLRHEGLGTVWRTSPGLALVRHSHARDRGSCASCPVVDACGGECWIQAHYAGVAAGKARGPHADFPYCGLVRPRLERLAKAEAGEETAWASHDGLLQPFECI